MQLIIAIIVTYIFSLLSLYIGYIIGSNRTDKPVKINFPIFKKKTQLGSIPKLSQKDIELKGTRRGDTEKAMEETLDQII